MQYTTELSRSQHHQPSRQKLALATFRTHWTTTSLQWEHISMNHTLTSSGYNQAQLQSLSLGLNVGSTTNIIREYQGKTYQSTYLKHGFIFIPPSDGTLYYQHEQPIDALYLKLNPAYVQQVLEPFVNTATPLEFRTQLSNFDPIIEQLFFALRKEAQNPTFGSQLMVEALTQQLIIHLARHYSSHYSERKSLEMVDLTPAQEYIHAHLDKNLSIQELARVVYLSPYHFSRLFKKQFGLAPHEYIIKQRIERVRVLLQNPKLTLAEIAIQVGFVDHSHLLRHFKRLTGRTPRA
jgi:AraC family transcriptional regulator